jgi:4'-phosphopantetheinyl transferase
MNVYWLEQREADVPVEDGWLSAGEAARLTGMRVAKRRADWRLGRWTAKRALAIYLGLPSHPSALAHLEIRPASSGAPEAFFAGQAAAATISLSHRAGMAMCAVTPAGAALGCDLELVETRSDAFIADYFTLGEQALVARALAADRPRLLALLWSAKESTLKALREGLRLDTRRVVVNLGDWDRPLTSSHGLPDWRPLQVGLAAGQTFHGWWRHTGSLVRTIVAVPPPAEPIALAIPADADANICREHVATRA